MSPGWAAAFAVWLAAAAPVPAPAPHDVDVTSVARVFVDGLGERRYLLSIVDFRVPPITEPAAVIPERCSVVASDALDIEVASGFVFECQRPLDGGDTLTLPWRLAGVVVIARWADGYQATSFFRGRRGTVPVPIADLLPEGRSAVQVGAAYLVLGTEHILLGVDHLLFVLGLLLLVRGLVPLVKTITAFTVAHSLTLGASVVGWIPVDRAPIEAAIALSIVLLAREIVMAGRGVEHLTHRKPWLVAFVFGLLHGFGFAGALSEIGLPDRALPVALLFFNLGVEAGQLLFVAALVAVHRLVARLGGRRLPSPQPVMGYALGAIATLWLFDRLPAVWGG